jgi:hypothetical protein
MSDSRVYRLEIFVAAAVVAAHANSSSEGFRQRDVKFLFDLFTNWVEGVLHGESSAMQNTQVARFMSSLVREGYARQIGRRRPPAYRLSRVGLIELISRMVDREHLSNREHFLFLYYFISNYRPRIEELIRNEGRQFPYSMRLELQTLLDSSRMLDREIASCERELKKLNRRIEDAIKTSELATDLVGKRTPLEEIVAKAEKLYPYELNSQKPLTELIAGIPKEMRLWELQTGNRKRAEEIWAGSRAILERYLEVLRGLRKTDRVRN